ncbi:MULTISPECIES: hypothetical protein [unclassified Moorena]|uniref:hypothetical protein n=1 Tax=unclassified Moorena TaxID=2683338 RepID=UPI0013C58F96|nr:MULTISPECIES: hypothetical protein [unclassified Moorena]NEO22394.1 hypothetical protein [Moorena sp. SIO4A5]NEQ61545.1 hypothetical protein [Moorena sp. SIO4A1]
MVSSQRSAVSYQPSAYALWTCLDLRRPSVEACSTKILITGILVEWASWWNGHLGGTGILVEWASWWNWHLGGMGILVELASCQFHAYFGAGRMPTLLLLIRRAGCPLYCYSFFSRFPKITKPRKNKPCRAS